MRMHSSQAPKPYRIPAMAKAVMVTLKTEIPDTAAASELPPTAYMYLPRVVLFQMNHMIQTTATAHRIMVGNLPILGITMPWILDSMEPKETPLVAKVIRPNMISMLAMVEIKGWILKRAVKKPAKLVKVVVTQQQTTRAMIMRTPTGSPEKSKICPNRAPVLIPLCMIMVDRTMLVPTIRPTDRSVPPSRIRPPTPRARNIRGEAACRMFRILVMVSSFVCLTIGARIHRMTKIQMMAM